MPDPRQLYTGSFAHLEYGLLDPCGGPPLDPDDPIPWAGRDAMAETGPRKPQEAPPALPAVPARPEEDSPPASQTRPDGGQVLRWVSPEHASVLRAMLREEVAVGRTERAEALRSVVGEEG